MDLKIKDVAQLLSVSETTIRRWIAENKIPVYRLNHQFRFNRNEIEDWVLSCRMVQKKGVDFFEKHPEKQKEQSSLVNKSGTMQYSLYRAIYHGDVFLDIAGVDKETIIQNAVKKIAPKINCDTEVLFNLLMEREKLMPTSINHGIAVPHTRDFLLQETSDFIFVVFPRIPVDYGALDGQPVHTLFFFFASQDKRHLHLLAKIAHLSSSEKALQFLANKPNKIALLEFVKEMESKAPLKKTNY